MEPSVLGIAIVLVLGTAAQWVADRLRWPSILLLLAAGFIAGPVTGVLDPDALMGGLLFPFVSVAVAIILFEGGLTLQRSEIDQTSRDVTRLVTLGAAITAVISGTAAYYVLGLNVQLAALLGAILTVTGPTVVLPLIRHTRPSRAVGAVLKWEGIVIDPVGAILAVLVFEAIVATGPGEATEVVAMVLLRTTLVAVVLGAAGAAMLVGVMARNLIPDRLHSPLTLSTVVGVFAASNLVQAESGLATVTVMGILLANQVIVDVEHIAEFKENLRELLISSLFVLLAARLALTDLLPIRPERLVFVAILVLVARPLSVFLSTIGSSLTWRERTFVAWMAPRGIVAAAVASIFALELEHAGFADAGVLVSEVFFVIITTVMLYGITAKPLARLLGVTRPQPTGVLFIGADRVARVLARALADEGVDVRMADTNRDHVWRAHVVGLSAHHANLLAEGGLNTFDLDEIGHLIAFTANDEVNSLATLRFASSLGAEAVYQLAPRSLTAPQEEAFARTLHGRFLFAEEASYDQLRERLAAGAKVKTLTLSEADSLASLTERFDGQLLPLFVVRDGSVVTPIVAGESPRSRPGDVLLGLVSRESLPAVEALRSPQPESSPSLPAEPRTADESTSDAG